MRRSALLLAILAGLGVPHPVQAGAERLDAPALAELVPQLPPDYVEVLLAPDEELHAYCAADGFGRSQDLVEVLLRAIPRSDSDSARAKAGKILPLARRVAEFQATYHGTWVNLDLVREIEVRGPSWAGVLDDRRERLMRGLDFPLSADGVARTFAVEEEVGNWGPSYLASVHRKRAVCYRWIGDLDSFLSEMETAIALYQESGMAWWAAYHLGSLYGICLWENLPEAGSSALRRLEELAQHIHAPETLSRRYSLQAEWYRAQGRHGLAHEALENELHAAGPVRGFRLRACTELMALYLDLECYRAAESLRPLTYMLRDHVATFVTPGQLRFHRERTMVLECQLLLAENRFEEAIDCLARARSACQEVGDLPFVAWSSYYRAEAFLALSRFDDAAREIDAVQEESERGEYSAMFPRLAVLRAEIALGRDDIEAARGWIARFDELAEPITEDLSKHRLRRDLAAIRTAEAEGDAARVVDELDKALARLESAALRPDAGASAHLLLDTFLPLRDHVLDRIDDDPSVSLDFEMAWRRLHDRRLRDIPRPESAGSLATVAALAGTWARRLDPEATLLGEGCADLVFSVSDRMIRRWYVCDGVVRLDTLPDDPEDLRSEIERALDDLSRASPDLDMWAGTSTDRLTALGARLLPPDLRASPPPRLRVTPDAFLEVLPFDALGLGPDDYRPLVETTDVVNLRFRRAPLSPPDGPVLVLRPSYGDAIRRRRPGLRELPGGDAEARRVESLFPSARLLEAREASKAKLMEQWSSASMIYVAAHVISSPECPFNTFIPLPAAGDSRPDAEYLDGMDVESASLDRCRLVVLSACASGAPHVEGTRAAPSLGSMFLNAGAAAVIQTLWRVEDESTRQLMTAVMERIAAGEEVVSALAAEKRARVRTREGGTSPFHWAAFTIQTTSSDALILNPLATAPEARVPESGHQSD